MMSKLKLAALFLAAAFLTHTLRAQTTQPADAQPQFLQATTPRAWFFPRDHARHDGFKTEWWYYTGNLVDDSGRKFGYQLTFFRTALTPESQTRPSAWQFHDLYFAHAAVSDLQPQRFYVDDCLSRQHAGLAESSDQFLDVRLLDWTAKMTGSTTALHATANNFAIDLTCTQGRGPILQGPGGINAKGHHIEQASYYYSMTRLPTTGLLTINGQKFNVHGQTWMDHEFSSNALAPEQTGWDWMGLSLADGNDLMLYRMRNKQGQSDYLSATLIDPAGNPKYLNESQITLESANPWQSPATNGIYPQQWTLNIPGLPNLIVTSRMPAQEVITTSSIKISYFEGSAEVRTAENKPYGEGYLEMTGYGKSLSGL
ncbi:MAG: carotenoid 1,2-hydratase [Planctomycetota bacterium]|nr:carotenoid 1,2-hydratase [Planctomycetota bacterium]